jgi:hypothetical protein
VALRRIGVLLVLFFAMSTACAEQFVVFPDRKELHSPDGRFVIRSVEHVAGPSEFSGVVRSLSLVDVTTGVSRGLYHYLGRVAVGWSGNNFLIVTDYASKRTSRALVFRMDRPNEYTVIDKPHLAAKASAQLRARLEGNDHVYLEVSKIEVGILTLRVWGYGARDAQGFRFLCAYDLN